nr:hypothetical protein [uncultured Desulfobacter sp.]
MASWKDVQGRLVKMVEQRSRQLKESNERLLHQDKMASPGSSLLPWSMKSTILWRVYRQRPSLRSLNPFLPRRKMENGLASAFP